MPAGLPGLAREVDTTGGFLAAEPDSLRSQALHAVSRLTYGQTPKLLADVERTGVPAFIERQLAPHLIDDRETDDLMATFGDVTGGELADELQFATLIRALRSERQLFEVMVDFWSNHFNVSSIGDARPLKPRDDESVIRRHAMGTFVELLQASAKSPAMLTYLSNRSSTGARPNENYGRELLELHTVGVGGGYSEADVRQAALVFTGWSVDEGNAFVFKPPSHYLGALRVMGWSASATTATDAAVTRGRDLLRYLAAQPATARHIAYKLCRRFVSDEPPSDLVATTANVFLSSGGATVAVLRHIFGSDAFWSARGTKLRRPFDLIAAGLRATGARISAVGGIRSPAGPPMIALMRRSGQAPFWWKSPNGYPDHAAHWMGGGSHVLRWNSMFDLALGNVTGVVIDSAALAGDAPTVGDVVTALSRRLLGQPLTGAAWQSLVDFTGLSASARAGRIDLGTRDHLVGLILSGPRFQVR